MSRFTSFAALVALTLGSVVPFVPRAAAAETSAVTITQDGADLVVKTSVTVNNSAHVLWTSVIDSGNTVTLRYYVIQNPDLFVRSQKKVDVSWRIPNRKLGDVKIGVQEVFQPNATELKALLPQLKELAEAGELWKKIRELQPPRGADAPPLTFTRDGTDLVVRATVQLKSNERVLWTHAIVGSETVTLEYVVVAHDSLSVTSKQVELTWRVPGNIKTSGMKFVVQPDRMNALLMATPALR